MEQAKLLSVCTGEPARTQASRPDPALALQSGPGKEVVTVQPSQCLRCQAVSRASIPYSSSHDNSILAVVFPASNPSLLP